MLTDERQGESLWEAIARLPRGSGIVFRHYRLSSGKRRQLFERVRSLARRRRLLLLLAGKPSLAVAWRADGSHGRGNDRRHARIRTAPAHDLRELRAAERAGADLAFLSPLFATRSHPGTPCLGTLRFGRLVRQARIPIIALGGMNARRWRRIAPLGADGWAAIDAWSEAT
jgi:thiamine-phosphate pyrophosphorylase